MLILINLPRDDHQSVILSQFQGLNESKKNTKLVRTKEQEDKLDCITRDAT